MKEIRITGKESGERLDRMLRRYLPGAGSGFLYRMIRKKNITVNDSRADAAQKLQAGDVVKLWLSDDTITKFSGEPEKSAGSAVTDTFSDRNTVAASVPDAKQPAAYPYTPLDIVFENDHVLFINKPAGMLSQKAAPKDVSLCEYLIGYLLHTEKISSSQLRLFKPSVCNRLDRGTSGLVACGTSIRGLQEMSELIRDRRVRKFYRCLVAGRLKESRRLDGWLLKDPDSNTVQIFSKQVPEAKRIITEYKPLCSGKTGAVQWTCLEVELITGRSHQIRAHLSSIGHPLLGDRRYGDRKINAQFESLTGIRDQMLHAYRMEFPGEINGSADTVRELAGAALTAPVPESYTAFMNGTVKNRIERQSTHGGK